MVPAAVLEEEKLDAVLIEKEGDSSVVSTAAAQKKTAIARAKSVSKQESITINC